MKAIIQDLDYRQISTLAADMGQPAFRAKQLYEGITQGKDISQISTLPETFRQRLLNEFEDCALRIEKVFAGADGTKKFLFSLADGNVIEGVLMNYKYGKTLCVSTQIGCRMGCKFCASTLNGLVRSLTAGEILAQVIVANRINGGTIEKREITNIVLMGSGEPFDNYENVVKFLKNVNAPEGLNISYRNISLSTCGLVPEMKAFADLELPVNLTISLHSPYDERRKEIMPIANKYSIAEITQAAKYYFEKTKRRVIFEYTLIEGQNDSEKDARRLAELVRGFSSHINLIRLNPVKERGLKATKEDKAQKFLEMLEKMNVSATIRRQMGVDINGACGQLRNSYLEKNAER